MESLVSSAENTGGPGTNSSTRLRLGMLPLAFFLLLSISLAESRENVGRVAEKLLGNNTITVNTTTEAGTELLDRWTRQAMSALMAAVAHEKIQDLPQRVADDHEKCAQKAETLQKHAKCVAKLLEPPKHYRKSETRWEGSFRLRAKRGVVNRKKYRMTSSHERSPFGMIAKQITNTIRAMKNKKEQRSWKTIVEDIRIKGKEMEKQKIVQEMIRGTFRKRKPIKNKYAHLPDAKEMADRFMDDPGSINPSLKQQNKELIAPINLIREGVNIGLKLSGRNVSNFDRKNVKLISPRFFSLVPEEAKNDTVDVLSPSLFSLHDDGEGIERMTSLASGMGLIDGKDQNAWMNMITEVAGISDAVEDAEKKIREKSEGVMTNSEGKPVHLSKENVTALYGEDGYRTMKVLEKIHSTYSSEQMEQFNKTGYALMTRKQRELIYGKGAPFEDEKALMAAENLKHSDVKKQLHKTIRHFASGKASFSRRMKDIVLSPIIGGSIILSPATASQALVLSPVLFTPLVLSPAIFGSVILSPWLFVPVIIAPRLLSPLVLSPALFSPIVLSPLALDPVILSPGVANPIILSPLLLSPLILSPQVLTPLILSPMALSPLILSPFNLSPLVLSPFVLSPSILSPPSVTALILSPYALSPSIASPPTAITVFGSPSVLS